MDNVSYWEGTVPLVLLSLPDFYCNGAHFTYKKQKKCTISYSKHLYAVISARDVFSSFSYPFLIKG